jgi:hypothetical protein
LKHLWVAQPVTDVQTIAAALHHVSVLQRTQLLGNVRLALPSGAYASLSDNAVVISDVTSALLGTRPDETTFSSITNPGVVRMS